MHLRTRELIVMHLHKCELIKAPFYTCTNSLWRSELDDAATDSDARHENACMRCHAKVYPVEKVGVGVVLHRNCFRCATCGTKLTLASFVLSTSAGRRRKDVYCRAHAPKPVSCEMDRQAVGIRNAVDAQKISKTAGFNNQASAPPKSCCSGWASAYIDVRRCKTVNLNHTLT